MADAAAKAGFEWDSDDGEVLSLDQLVSDFLLEKHFQMKCRLGANQNLVINGKAAINAIIADIKALERGFLASK